MLTAPPTLYVDLRKLDASGKELPALSSREPASPSTLADPTERVSEPELPEVEDPEDMFIAPLVPPALDPVARAKEPLIPRSPPEFVSIAIDPE